MDGTLTAIDTEGKVGNEGVIVDTMDTLGLDVVGNIGTGEVVADVVDIRRVARRIALRWRCRRRFAARFFCALVADGVDRG